MERIFAALWKGLGSMLHPRMLWLMVWPILVALAVWASFAALYWSQAAKWIDLELHRWPAYEWAISVWPLTLLGAALAWVLLLFLFVPVVLITAVLIISVVSMPAMVAHVGEHEYPGLAREKGGTFAGSLWNAIASLVLFSLLFAVTLPLWLIPLLWPVLPVALFGYFNQRVFRYDALAEHATAKELVDVVARNRGELFVLGVVLALVGHLPLVGLAMPVYAGLVFIHYGLARLGESRGGLGEGGAGRA